jgi:hypothetical protein
MAKKPKLTIKTKLGGKPGYGFNLMATREHISTKLEKVEGLGISPKISVSDEGELTLEYNLKDSMSVGFRGETDKKIEAAITAIGTKVQEALGLGTGITEAEKTANDKEIAELRQKGMLPINYMSELEYKEE